MAGFANLTGFDKKTMKVKTEVIAGIVTFFSMAYILAINPELMLNLSGEDQEFKHLYSSVFVATALGGFIGTLLMALYAKLPLAQAPGLGFNSMIGGLLGGSLIGFSVSFGKRIFFAEFLCNIFTDFITALSYTRAYCHIDVFGIGAKGNELLHSLLCYFFVSSAPSRMNGGNSLYIVGIH